MSQKIWCFFEVHSFGPEKDGKVTCQVCGKVETVECSHVWKEIKKHLSSGVIMRH